MHISCAKLLFTAEKKSPGKGGRREKFFFSSARLTSPNDTKEKNNGGGLYPADPKGRRLAPCDFVCKATRSPHARQRDNSEQTQGLPPTKGSRMAASEKPRRTSTPIPSLINIKSNTKRRRARTHVHTLNKHLFAFAYVIFVCVCVCGVWGGVRAAAPSPHLYLSLHALALNECSSTLGHITFVFHESL